VRTSYFLIRYLWYCA